MSEGRKRTTRRSFAMSTRWRRALATIALTSVVGLANLVDADPCVFSNGQTKVTIGETTAVCLVVNPLVWEVVEEPSQNVYSQVLITPKADEFSRFSVTGSWQNLTHLYDPMLLTFGNDVGVHVESTGKYSYQKAFRTQNKTFPIFTAIIAVDEGEVTGISWDDGCHFCRSSQCQPNTYDFDGEIMADSGKDCSWPDEDCIQSSTNRVSSICHLTVYVVWTGTDSKGNYFTSYSKRLSTYSEHSLDDYLDDVSGTYQFFEQKD